MNYCSYNSNEDCWKLKIKLNLQGVTELECLI